MAPVRIALVSPYSYTYPGGVIRHVEASAEELLRRGHDVRLFAPYDPDDRLARVTHRGARPEPREKPDHFVSLGRTLGIPMNGAVSNVCVSPYSTAVLGRALREESFDVLHVHEPNGAVASWFAVESARIPVVGTFHSYATKRFAHHVAANVINARRLYSKLHARIAVSEAARWTAERFYGGNYTIVPNGVDLSAAPSGPRPAADHLRLLFVGRAEERKGLPILLRAFEALRGTGITARLTIAGATPEEVEPYLLDPEGVEILGRVSDGEKWRLLHDSDLVCAPSLGGESFGMVLTEAFAAGTPVVCSDIAGYREVVRSGVDGLLVPAGDPVGLGEALHGLAIDPDRRHRMAAAARDGAERFAWPTVTGQVLDVYQTAIQRAAAPATRTQRAGLRTGLKPADGLPRNPPRRIPSIEPELPGAGRRRAARLVRRAAVVGGAVGGIGLAALALDRIGIDSIFQAMVAATPWYVLVAFALMCVSMLARAESWHAILRAALPYARVRRRHAVRGVMIGVLMSATLPARLGEPSRALIVARRLGRVRERLPVVLGTLVSQTLLNLVALVVLGGVMFATVGLFRGHEDALILVAIAPVVALLLVALAPVALRKGAPSRFVRVQNAAAKARRAMTEARRGLRVFRNPKLGAWAAFMQLLAWAIQWLACYALLIALGLDHQAGVGAAAAVL
ncbi:MAG: phosphatidyl-myo-inositol alpha-mannosyltransferase, partial [Thermoleophilaceae bacterium]|nr:phosphatidyl-myo-inositol alpha-mannosyltransferase [Thermoleophilaceae bacterium]